MAKNRSNTATWCGFDLSTTGLAVGVRSSTGKEAYVNTKIRGANRWNRQPAFFLEQVPGMILSLLKSLTENGWQFHRTTLSFAVRQHDMAVLDRHGELLMPALSWQCNAAEKQVKQLRDQGAEAIVGRIEERFILPKLMWVLHTTGTLRRSISEVTTTGDWIARMLTGKSRLSTSDAISNGLLVQQTKKLAEGVMRKAKLNPKWFPKVIQSGRPVGRVTDHKTQGADDDWMKVKEILKGAQVIAGLGDNHATGVGCGLEEKAYGTIVVSAGTSGTVNRVCPSTVPLAGNAACFEFYQDRMLLMMLADCCSWYDSFVSQYASRYADRLDELNSLAGRASLQNIRRILAGDGGVTYPPNWRSLSPGERAASTQFSIML
ncbi:MAG: FGGY family carbohydrate kinase, partial [Planctomycetales bacterium]